MNTSMPNSSTGSLSRSNFHDYQSSDRSTVSWGAIFAGATAGLALQVLFMMLGAGLGLAIYSPITSENPVANLSIGALIIHSICALISLFFGGWVAGRFTPVAARAAACLHGFIVWCTCTVGGVLLVALGAGAVVGGASSLIGGGLSAVGKPVAAAADGAVDLASDAMKQSGDTISSFVDEAVSSMAVDAPENAGIRAKREIGFAVARLFNSAQEGDATTRRDAAVTALVNHAGMNKADADRAVTEWTETFERLQADLTAAKEAAATKAREAADSTASAMAKFSLWAFVGFLLGALAASWGGNQGAKCATRCDETCRGKVVPSQDA